MTLWGDRVTENEIQEYDGKQLLSKNTFEELYNMEDLPERERFIALLTIKANELKIGKEFAKIISLYNKADKALAEQYTKVNAIKNSDIFLDFTSKGIPDVTVDNFLRILRGDGHFKSLKFNLLANAPEKVIDGSVVRWSDTDDSDARSYIEKKYHIHSKDKLEDALKIRFREVEYHPIKEIIEGVTWDGVERIPTFLHKWMKCEDTEYTREVSRLVFAGGINRLYDPGCKFDDMLVLIGTSQGEGKSTFVRWLALKDEFFTEVCEIEGQRGVEALEGAWICEIAELLALTKVKEVEAVKSYITKKTDRYRRPYEKRTTEVKRQCIFIGTTNKEQFLTDKTGNRRYYPVKVYQSGYELYSRQEEFKADVLQAWAEALVKMKKGKLLPYADYSIMDEIKEQQKAATEDDVIEGLILDYLDKHTVVCVLELWEKALGNMPPSKPTRKESNDIVLILQSSGKWRKPKSVRRYGKYGVQRVWEKIPDENGFIEVETDEAIPFE